MDVLQVNLYDIDVDGLPQMEDLTGRVAFIHDGAIYSGWPLFELHLRYPESNHPVYTKYDWEASEGVNTVYTGVKKYIIFDNPIWNL